VDLWGSALLSGFARASRLNEVTEYVDTVSTRAGMPPAQALTSIAFMLRLAPELFAFHLLLWQIAKERP
jgi:predicted permease